MELWTSGRVSAVARKAWQADTLRAQRDRTFVKVNGGYRLVAWESEIALCRALGRGAASGKGIAAHRFDTQA